MAINLTDSLNAATTKGKLGDAKQVYLNGDTKNLQQAYEETSTHFGTLDNRSTQMEETIKGIAATGGASQATAVTYDNTTSKLTSVNIQGAVDELQGSKIDKTSILQESGEAEYKVMSQKATTTAIADETTRAKAAEEAIIFDVSVYNNGAVFESLQALLSNSNLNTLIPISARHGGITIRFIQGSVQSPDNKYVQYRLISATWSTTVADWQGVDDEPTDGSDNFVKSGGVSNKLTELGSKMNDVYPLEWLELTTDRLATQRIPKGDITSVKINGNPIGNFISARGWAADGGIKDFGFINKTEFNVADIVGIDEVDTIQFIIVSNVILADDVTIYTSKFDKIDKSLESVHEKIHDLSNIDELIMSASSFNAIWHDSATDRKMTNRIPLHIIKAVRVLNPKNKVNCISVRVSETESSPFIDLGWQNDTFKISDLNIPTNCKYIIFTIDTTQFSVDDVKLLQDVHERFDITDKMIASLIQEDKSIKESLAVKYDITWVELTTDRLGTQRIPKGDIISVKVAGNPTGNYISAFGWYANGGIKDLGWINKTDFNVADIKGIDEVESIQFRIISNVISADDVTVYSTKDRLDLLEEETSIYIDGEWNELNATRFATKYLNVKDIDRVRIDIKPNVSNFISAFAYNGKSTHDCGWINKTEFSIHDINGLNADDITIQFRIVYPEIKPKNVKIYSTEKLHDVIESVQKAQSPKDLVANVITKNATIVSDYKKQKMAHCATLAVHDGYAYVVHYGNDTTVGESYSLATTYLDIVKVDLCDMTKKEKIGTFTSNSNICGFTQGNRPPYDPNVIVKDGKLLVYIQAYKDADDSYTTIILPYDIASNSWGNYIECSLNDIAWTNKKMDDIYKGIDNIIGKVVYSTFTGKIIKYNNEYWSCTGQACSDYPSNMPGFIIKSSDGIHWYVVSIFPFKMANNFECSMDIKDGLCHIIVRLNAGYPSMYYTTYDIATNAWGDWTPIADGISSKGWVECFNRSTYILLNVVNPVIDGITVGRGAMAVYQVESDGFKKIFSFITDEGISYPTLAKYHNSVYMVYSSDRRHLNYDACRSNICLMDVGTLLR